MNWAKGISRLGGAYLATVALGAGISSGAGPCLPLAAWLDGNANVAKALVWDGPAGPQAWPDWPAARKAELDAAYSKACRGESAVAVDPLPNQQSLADGDFATTRFSEYDAKELYLATVAHGLALETQKALGWSVATYSPAALAALFDSRAFFSWKADAHGYVLDEDRGGLISPADPALVWTFLTRNDLIAATGRGTIERWITWSTQLSHDFTSKAFREKKLYRETTGFVDAFWHTRGFPPVSRVLSGTRQTMDPGMLGELRHWTAGCWGTTGFAVAVLRVANVPVELKAIRGHAYPHFLSEAALLSHGDDPYNRLFTTLPKPAPVGDLLLPDAAPPQIGIGPAQAAVKYAQGLLLDYYCADDQKNTAPERGQVFDALKAYFTMSQLQEARLWQRLQAGKRAGGCQKR